MRNNKNIFAHILNIFLKNSKKLEITILNSIKIFKKMKLIKFYFNKYNVK